MGGVSSAMSGGEVWRVDRFLPMNFSHYLTKYLPPRRVASCIAVASVAVGAALTPVVAFAAPSDADVRLVKDIAPGADAGVVDDAELWAWSEASGQLFFLADDGVHGVELWVTDGSESGTRMVEDINASGDISIYDIAPFDDGVLIGLAADGDSNNHELWFSDGTAAGTSLVKDINPTGGSEPWAIVQIGDVAYFSAWNGVDGFEPWVTDGTSAGTRMVTDLRPGSRGSDPDEFTALGDQVVFTADDGPDDGKAGHSLWITDGTGAGTTEFFEPGLSPSFDIDRQSELTAIDGLVYFNSATHDGTSPGTAVFATDGTNEGTRVLIEVHSEGGAYTGFFDMPAGVLFNSSESGASSPTFWWVTDGSAAGTTKVLSSLSNSVVTHAAQACNTVVFTGSFDGAGRELGATDGTEENSGLLLDMDGTSASSWPYEYITVGDYALFGGSSDGVDGELWITDGSLAGTYELADIEQSGNGSWPYEFIAAGSKGFFLAYDEVHGYELWVAEMPEPTGNCHNIAAAPPAPSTTLPGTTVPATNAPTTAAPLTGLLPSTGTGSIATLLIAFAISAMGWSALRAVRRP